MPDMPVPVDQLLPFLLASVLITVVPGADMALVTRQVLLGGPTLAQKTIAGNLTGIVVHGVALAVGLSALLVASATAYTVVKLAGAAYLCFLGVQALLAARRAATATATEVPSQLPSRRKAFGLGLMSTVLNPKPALFFLTFLPQFVDEQRSVLPQIAFLAAVHVAVGLVWLTLYAHLVHRAHRMLTRADVKRWLEGVTGAVLIALGIRVALERR
jgi:threonine/homoserine/homoserine lactone efflux protein